MNNYFENYLYLLQVFVTTFYLKPKRGGFKPTRASLNFSIDENGKTVL